MRLTRRTFVKAGAVASALGGGQAAQVIARDRPALVVYDSRIAESRAFAAGQPAPGLDVAEEHGRRWTALRKALPQGRIVGLTRWSDLVIVRGYAEEQGRRLRHERRVGMFFAWEMA